MNYDQHITTFINTQMKSKTKLHFKDIEREILKWLKVEYAGEAKISIPLEKLASRIFDDYKRDSTDLKTLDSDMAYYIYMYTGNVVIFSNTWNTYIQRQKPLKDKKGKFIVVINSEGKAEKLYGV